MAPSILARSSLLLTTPAARTAISKFVTVVVATTAVRALSTAAAKSAMKPSAAAAAAAGGGTARPVYPVTISPIKHRRPFHGTPEMAATVSLAFDLHEPTRPTVSETERPILFLHGLFGSKKNNRSLSRALARDTGRFVYALDLRNHGDSPHIPRHDYVAMSDDVSAFITEHKLTNPTVIGHSMGAKTAMTLALRQPDLLTDIVAVDNAPVDVTLAGDFDKYIRGMKLIDQKGVRRQSEADRILEEYEKSIPIRQFLLSNLQKPEAEDDPSSNSNSNNSTSNPPSRIAQALHQSQGQNNNHYRFRIPLGILGRALNNLGDFPFKDPSEVRFLKPALFVRGTHSRYVPDEVIPLIGQFFPLFELKDIECGHWVTAEKPEEFKQAVLEFFDRED